MACDRFRRRENYACKLDDSDIDAFDHNNIEAFRAAVRDGNIDLIRTVRIGFGKAKRPQTQ